MQEFGLNPFIPKRIDHEIPSEFVRMVSSFPRNEEVDSEFADDLNLLLEYAGRVEKFQAAEASAALGINITRAYRLISEAGTKLKRARVGKHFFLSLNPIKAISSVNLAQIKAMATLRENFLCVELAESLGMHIDSSRKLAAKHVTLGFLSKKFQFVQSGQSQIYTLTKTARDILEKSKNDRQ